MTKRNKKRYEAQQMIVLLGALAHNVVVWSRRWLGEVSKIKQHGVLRIVRVVFHVCGFIEIGAKNVIKRIILNEAAWALPRKATGLICNRCRIGTAEAGKSCEPKECGQRI